MISTVTISWNPLHNTDQDLEKVK